MGLEFTTHYKDGVEGFLPGLIEAIKDKYASTTTQGSSELAAAYQNLINALFDPNSYKGQGAAAAKDTLKLEQHFHDAFAFASRGSGDSYGGVYQVGRNQGFQDEKKRRDEQLKVLKQMDRVANTVRKDLRSSPVQKTANVSKLMAQIRAIQADLHRFNIGANEKYNRLRKKDKLAALGENAPALKTSNSALFDGARMIDLANFDEYFASLYNAYANSIGAYLGRENAKILGLTGETIVDIVNAASQTKGEEVASGLYSDFIAGLNNIFRASNGQRFSRVDFARNMKQRKTVGSNRVDRTGSAYVAAGKNGVWDGNIAKNLQKIKSQLEGQKINIEMEGIKGYLDNRVFVSVQQKADSFAASITINTTADIEGQPKQQPRTWENVGMSVKNWSDMFGDYATFGHTTAAKALMRTLSSVTNERGTYQALGLATSPTKYIARDWLTMLKAAAAYDILVGISQGQGHQADLIVIRDNKRNGGNLFKVYSGYDLLVENLDKVCQSITFEPEPSFPIPATMRGARAAYALNYLEGIKVSLGTGFLK